MRPALALLFLSAWISTYGWTFPDRYNKILAPGDKAPSWSNLPGTDGKPHSLAEFKDKQVLVVIFLCCSCPAVEDYEERILDFAKKHCGPDSKVGLVGINVNTIEEDSLENMKLRATEKKYSFPYLFDKSQKIAKDFGAAYTPEFFVLDKERKVVYMGAMDDRDNPTQAKERFLEEAVLAALEGKTPKVRETLGRGCRIRYERARR